MGRGKQLFEFIQCTASCAQGSAREKRVGAELGFGFAAHPGGGIFVEAIAKYMVKVVEGLKKLGGGRDWGLRSITGGRF